MRKCSLFRAAVLAAFSLSLSALDIPFSSQIPVLDGKLADECWQNLPWNEGFTLVGSQEPVQERTRFKIFHDNWCLYIGIEALESDMEHLRATSYSPDSQMLWRNDSLELEFTKDPALLQFRKCIIDCTGQIADLLCVDNNTDSEIFNTVFEWKSSVQVKTGREKDRWVVELALPFGCMDFTPVEKLAWRLNLGRNRYAGGEKTEISSWAPISGRQKPKQFRAVSILSFQPKKYHFEFGKYTLSFTKETDGKYTLKSNMVVHNQTGSFKILRNRLAQDITPVREAEQQTQLGAGQYETMTVTIADARPGECVVNYALYSSGSRPMLLKQISRVENLQYHSVSARMIRPPYRNNIYATMPDKTIEAGVSMKEGIGSPLTVELIGPQTHQRKVIANGRTENTVVFDGSQLPDGKYVLRSSICVNGRNVTSETVIRKLPYRKGEVWLDRNGVTYVDGKKFMPFGWYGAYDGPAFPWVNNVLFLNLFDSPESAVKAIQSYREKNPNLRLILVPFQDLDPRGWVPPRIFAFENMKKSLTAVQKEKIRQFVSYVSKTDGVLGWYMADEPEGRDLNPNWYEEARDLIAELDPYHPCLLLNYGTDGIRKFYKGCDILIPDCYPQYFEDGTTSHPRWCSSEWARTSTVLRPAWQMPQGCLWPVGTPQRKGIPPDLADQRSELLQAFAHNVKGINFYAWYLAPKYSELRLGTEVNGKTLYLLKDYLLQNSIPGGITVTVSPKVPEFQAALKMWDGKPCIIAVNTSLKTVTADFVLENGFNGTLYGAGEKTTKIVKNGRFSDTFAPKASRIYLTNAELASAVPDVQAAAKAIADYKASRKKKGNLVGIGQMTDVDYCLNADGKGGPDIPGIQASSDHTYWGTSGKKGTISMHLPGSLYFMFDGETDPLRPEYAWAPLGNDKNPWMEITLSKAAPARRMVLYTPNGNLRSCRVTDDAGKSFSVENPEKKNVITVTLGGNQTKKLRIEFLEFVKSSGNLGGRLLTEVEVY